jgi:hypothetical protein
MFPFLELKKYFLRLKYLNSLMRIRDPGWKEFGSGIREGKKSDPGYGKEKSRIRDKHPGSATLVLLYFRVPLMHPVHYLGPPESSSARWGLPTMPF